MKALHRSDLYGWSQFDEARDMDFHGVLWVHPEGNVAFDPVPMSDHDWAHARRLGGVAHIVVTNRDHVRWAAELRERSGAKLWGPSAERDAFPVACDGWLTEGAGPVAGIRVFEMDGSKTPGELAVLLGEDTLFCGDLVRAPRGGRLDALPPEKLRDAAAALRSIERLAALEAVQAVLVGDGWHAFRDGHLLLADLVVRLLGRR